LLALLLNFDKLLLDNPLFNLFPATPPSLPPSPLASMIEWTTKKVNADRTMNTNRFPQHAANTLLRTGELPSKKYKNMGPNAATT
jgi:hypothetical protein